MTHFYCYIHKRKDGTPFYVGKGSNNRAYVFDRRSEWHKSIVAKEGGPNNIIVELYPATDEQNAFYLEKLFIKGLSLFFKLCNLTIGGDGPSGVVRSKELRAKISASLSGNKHPNFGKHLSEITRSKISKANKGTKLTEETKRNLSIVNTGPGNPNFGKPRSASTKEKIRQANSGDRGSGAKMTWEQIKEIRHLYETKQLSQRKLAAKFGLSRSEIIRIIRYESWKL